MVFAVIHPFCGDIPVGIPVRGKGLSVEFPDEILCGTAAERASGIDVAYQYPFLLVAAVNGQFEKVRAFPYPVLCAQSFPKCALQSPLFHVGRREHKHFVFKCMSQNQVPFPCGFIPEHIRVTCLAFERYYRITGIYFKRVPVVVAMSETLYLACGS